MKKQNLITKFFKMKSTPKKEESSTQASSTQKSKAEEEKEEFPEQKLDEEYKFDLDELKENFRDGRRIFHNRLKFYTIYRPDMIKFVDLLDEYLNNPDLIKEEEKTTQAENVVFTTFVSEDSFIAKTLIKKKIECTMFKHGYQTATVPVEPGKSVLDFPEINMRCILPDLKGKFSVFHPKVMLIKFPHFLRVVVTTCNFMGLEWECLGQLIWFQDFRYISDPIECRFKTDLMRFFQDIMPSETTITVKKAPSVYKDVLIDKFAIDKMKDPPESGKLFRQVIRGEINFEKYDFRDAAVDLIPSINGYYKIEDGSADNQGMIRVKNIMKNSEEFKVTDNTQLIYQCTSFGKLYTKLVTEFVMSMFGDKIEYTSVTMKERVKFIYPEDQQVQDAHEGVPSNCLKLREDFWFDQKDFPRYLFHKFEYKESSKEYTRNVHHSKVMIIKEKDQEIDDNSAIYIGSHNMSGGAWGTMRNIGKTLFIGNYEMGIFFKPKAGTKALKQRIVNSLLYTIDPPSYDLATEKPYLFVKAF
ncbi:unnamed protein product [Moneuplotes crassus]|uniref:PLD phosphodiesterase domain-containing protein n=1 Tax=Euplotes crassus TaxID=5936 RepID=A0AAD1UG92_EUPCR|nr:unnamed protein product [Moneuplotes crassus]